MTLIFGGAYQGKLDYVLEKYGLTEEDVFVCQGTEIDYQKKVIDDFEKYIYACSEAGIEAYDALKIEEIKDKIIICDDVSAGLVPLEEKDRKYREMSGRTLINLVKKSDEVIRIFCGLGSKLK